MRIHIEAIILVADYLSSRSSFFARSSTNNFKDSSALTALGIVVNNINVQHNKTTCKQAIREALVKLKGSDSEQGKLAKLLDDLSNLVTDFGIADSDHSSSEFIAPKVSLNHSKDAIITLGQFLKKYYHQETAQLKLSDDDISCILQIYPLIISMNSDNFHEQCDFFKVLLQSSDGISPDLRSILDIIYKKLPEITATAELIQRQQELYEADSKSDDEQVSGATYEHGNTPFSYYHDGML